MVASLWDDLLPCPVIYASWDSFSFAGPSQVGQGCSVLPVENGGVWLPRLDKRHHFSFFLASSWIACSGESQLPCYKGPQAAYGKSHVMKDWGLLSVAIWVHHLGSGSSSLTQAFRWLQLWPTSWANLIRDPEPKLPKSLLDSLPSETLWDNKYLLLLLAAEFLGNLLGSNSWLIQHFEKAISLMLHFPIAPDSSRAVASCHTLGLVLVLLDYTC